jgi:hypothetical protein
LSTVQENYSRSNLSDKVITTHWETFYCQHQKQIEKENRKGKIEKEKWKRKNRKRKFKTENILLIILNYYRINFNARHFLKIYFIENCGGTFLLPNGFLEKLFSPIPFF